MRNIRVLWLKGKYLLINLPQFNNVACCVLFTENKGWRKEKDALQQWTHDFIRLPNQHHVPSPRNTGTGCIWACTKIQHNSPILCSTHLDCMLITARVEPFSPVPRGCMGCLWSPPWLQEDPAVPVLMSLLTPGKLGTSSTEALWDEWIGRGRSLQDCLGRHLLWSHLTCTIYQTR